MIRILVNPAWIRDHTQPTRLDGSSVERCSTLPFSATRTTSGQPIQTDFAICRQRQACDSVSESYHAPLPFCRSLQRLSRPLLIPAGLSPDPQHHLAGKQRTRERAGWLLRDSLTTLALILAEKEEVSRLERAMYATWLDLEGDRRERFDESGRLVWLLFGLFSRCPQDITEAEV